VRYAEKRREYALWLNCKVAFRYINSYNDNERSSGTLWDLSIATMLFFYFPTVRRTEQAILKKKDINLA